MKKLIFLISFVCLSLTKTFGQTLDDKPFQIAAVPAEYPGGMSAFYKYIIDSLTYPEYAKTNRIEGRVYIEFVLDIEGAIVDELTRVTKSDHDSLNIEAISIINNCANWTPARLTKDGEFIKQKIVLPVSFSLPKEKKRKKKRN